MTCCYNKPLLSCTAIEITTRSTIKNFVTFYQFFKPKTCYVFFFQGNTRPQITLKLATGIKAQLNSKFFIARYVSALQNQKCIMLQKAHLPEIFLIQIDFSKDRTKCTSTNLNFGYAISRFLIGCYIFISYFGQDKFFSHLIAELKIYN